MKKVLDKLLTFKDEKYKEFTSKLVPTIDPSTIIGVRLPNINKYVKEFYHDDAKELFMKELPHKYLEENLLHMKLIAHNKDVYSCLNEIEEFLPYIDNWEVSDICPDAFKKDLDKTEEYVLKFLKSKHNYTIRFGIITLIKYFLDERFKDEYNTIISNIKSDDYYVNMAISWYFSVALLKQYDKTIYLFENKLLDKKIHNKSIQKALESYRISNDLKNELKSLKIK